MLYLYIKMRNIPQKLRLHSRNNDCVQNVHIFCPRRCARSTRPSCVLFSNVPSLYSRNQPTSILYILERAQGICRTKLNGDCTRSHWSAATDRDRRAQSLTHLIAKLSRSALGSHDVQFASQLHNDCSRCMDVMHYNTIQHVGRVYSQGAIYTGTQRR